MANKYKVKYCDGYYITKNGVGILDLANPEDGEFANYLVALLESAERNKTTPNKVCTGLGVCAPSQSLSTPKKLPARRILSKPAPSQ